MNLRQTLKEIIQNRKNELNAINESVAILNEKLKETHKGIEDIEQSINNNISKNKELNESLKMLLIASFEKDIEMMEDDEIDRCETQSKKICADKTKLKEALPMLKQQLKTLKELEAKINADLIKKQASLIKSRRRSDIYDNFSKQLSDLSDDEKPLIAKLDNEAPIAIASNNNMDLSSDEKLQPALTQLLDLPQTSESKDEANIMVNPPQPSEEKPLTFANKPGTVATLTKSLSNMRNEHKNKVGFQMKVSSLNKLVNFYEENGFTTYTEVDEAFTQTLKSINSLHVILDRFYDLSIDSAVTSDDQKYLRDVIISSADKITPLVKKAAKNFSKNYQLTSLSYYISRGDTLSCLDFDLISETGSLKWITNKFLTQTWLEQLSKKEKEIILSSKKSLDTLVQNEDLINSHNNNLNLSNQTVEIRNIAHENTNVLTITTHSDTAEEENTTNVTMNLPPNNLHSTEANDTQPASAKSKKRNHSETSSNSVESKEQDTSESTFDIKKAKFAEAARRVASLFSALKDLSRKPLDMININKKMKICRDIIAYYSLHGFLNHPDKDAFLKTLRNTNSLHSLLDLFYNISLRSDINTDDKKTIIDFIKDSADNTIALIQNAITSFPEESMERTPLQYFYERSRALSRLDSNDNRHFSALKNIQDLFDESDNTWFFMMPTRQQESLLDSNVFFNKHYKNPVVDNINDVNNNTSENSNHNNKQTNANDNQSNKKLKANSNINRWPFFKPNHNHSKPNRNDIDSGPDNVEENYNSSNNNQNSANRV